MFVFERNLFVMKRFVAILTVFVFALTFVACNGCSDDTPAGSSVAESSQAGGLSVADGSDVSYDSVDWEDGSTATSSSEESDTGSEVSEEESAEESKEASEEQSKEQPKEESKEQSKEQSTEQSKEESKEQSEEESKGLTTGTDSNGGGFGPIVRI